jgi:hypothetical protein
MEECWIDYEQALKQVKKKQEEETKCSIQNRGFIDNYLYWYYYFEDLINKGYKLNYNNKDFNNFQKNTQLVKKDFTLKNIIIERIINTWKTNFKSSGEYSYSNIDHNHECKNDCTMNSNINNIDFIDSSYFKNRINNNDNNIIPQIKTSSIEVISNTFSIFVCKKNISKVHICNKSDCKYILRDKHGMEICILSGYVLGSVLHNEGFKKTQVSKDSYYDFNNEDKNDYDHYYDNEEYSPEEEEINNEFYDDAINHNNNNADTSINKILNLTNNNNNSQEDDNMFYYESIDNQNNIITNNSSNDLIITDSNEKVSILEICDIPIETKIDTATVNYNLLSSYFNNDDNNNINTDSDNDPIYNHKYFEETPVNIEITNHNKQSSLINKCKTIISDLLFNRNVRNVIDKQKVTEATARTKLIIKNYYSDCFNNNITPSSIEVDNIICNILNKNRLVQIPYDDNKICYYCSIIVCLWKLIYGSFHHHHHQNKKNKKMNNKYHFKHFIVGLLYMMKKDINVSVKSKNNNDDHKSKINNIIGGNTSSSSQESNGNNSDIELLTESLEDTRSILLKNPKITIVNDPINSDTSYNMIVLSDSEEEKDENLTTRSNRYFNMELKQEEKITLFQKDDFVRKNLPKTSDLKKICYSLNPKKTYQKSDVSKGRKWIEKSLSMIKNKNQINKYKEEIKNIMNNSRNIII